VVVSAVRLRLSSPFSKDSQAWPKRGIGTHLSVLKPLCTALIACKGSDLRLSGISVFASVAVVVISLDFGADSETALKRLVVAPIFFEALEPGLTFSGEHVCWTGAR
jgi:hypothetical protein